MQRALPLHSVPAAAAGACEGVTAAFVGLCQGTLYSWKGFSVSVCRRCFDSDHGKKERPSSVEKQQIKSKGKCVQTEIEFGVIVLMEFDSVMPRVMSPS